MATLGTYPEGTMFWETPDYKGHFLRNINAVLITVSSLFVGTRLYVRLAMTKSPGLDDIIAIFAWAVICSQSALNLAEVQNGSGAHRILVPSPLITTFFQLLTTQTLVYFWSVGLMRLTIVAFLPRLSKDRIYLYIIYATAAIIVVQTNFAFWYKLFECRPVKNLWSPYTSKSRHCVRGNADKNMIISHAVIGIFIDVVLMGIPICLIWQNMMLSRKVIQVILIFSVGIFVIIAGIIRLWYINNPPEPIDPTYQMATVGVWTDLEGHVGLWVSCFPTIQPIIRIISAKIGLCSRLLSNYALRTGKNTDGVAGPSSEGVQKSTHGRMRSGNGVYRTGTDTDTDSQKAIVAASEDAFELGQIRKQTDFEVKVEQRDPEEIGSRQETWADV